MKSSYESIREAWTVESLAFAITSFAIAGYSLVDYYRGNDDAFLPRIMAVIFFSAMGFLSLYRRRQKKQQESNHDGRNSAA